MAEPLQTAVLLCKGSACVKGNLPVTEVSRFLQGYQPSMPVVIGDRLCEPRALSRHLPGRDGLHWVIAACSRLADGCEEIGVPVWQATIVEALKEFNSPLSPSETTERIKRLVWAQVNRAVAAQPIPRDALRLRTMGLDEKLSRRELFGMGRQRYEVIPYIDQGRCGRNPPRECGLCAESCSLHAIIPREGEISIDENLCRGCGACVVACPRDAVVYPTQSTAQLDREMEGLLDGEAGLQPRVIAFTCDEGKNEPFHYPANVLPLRVPCLALVSPWMLLRAIDRGAQGLVMILGKTSCRLQCDPAGCQKSILFVQELLTHWGLEQRRVKFIRSTENPPGELQRELEGFSREVGGFPVTRLKAFEPGSVPATGLPLAALIRDVGIKLGHSQIGIVAKSSAPFGRVVIDHLRCTGCSLCGLDCPTQALTFSWKGDGDAYQIRFQHDLCVGCGHCQKVCPEHCLHVKRGLDLDKLDKEPSILFESNIAPCRECGLPLFPQAMIAHVRTKLSAAGASVWAIDLCPSCRLKSTPFRERLADSPSREITI